MSVSPLLTDLYQLTMLQAYHDQGMRAPAVFEFFVRKLPPGRNFLLAAGLDQALEYLETLAFSRADCDWLASTGRFTPDFLARLRHFRFTGDVNALPEGTPCFPHEPLLQVVAPLPEAQLVETRLINLLNFQTLIASCAVRSVLAAPGRLLVDFGLRRAHGAEAGLHAARAAYLAGFAGTSNVLAGQTWDIPLFGTMAHAFVQAHEVELEAFEHFARSFPQETTLLIDTYDTEAAARALPPLLRRLGRDGIRIGAVRIDSGDLAAHAWRVRAILDAAGAGAVRIFASGDLDETRLRGFCADGVPIDAFGVGTRMVTSADQPWLDCAYKLQVYAGLPRRKRAEGKMTWPGRKQVWRRYDAAGRMREDVVATMAESPPGEPLLQPVMRGGRRLLPPVDLATLRASTAAGLARLPEALLGLDPAPHFPVVISPGLVALAEQVDQRLAGRRYTSPDIAKPILW